MTELSSRAFRYKASVEARRRSAAPSFTEPTTPDMGRKVLFILVCCLGLSRVSGNSEKGQVQKQDDSASETRVSHLYRKVPVGVYASASPYGAFSYHSPTFITAPKNARIIPVNEERILAQSTNGLLKDSYGNKFIDPAHTVGFKTTLPQQFVRLQDLPLHLSQPLVPGAPALQFKQGTPHYFAPSQFQVQGLQAHSPFARYAAVPHPLLNEGNLRQFASSPVLQNNFNPHPVIQQQSTSNRAILSNTQSHEQYNKLRDEPKFQRLQEGPKENGNPGNTPEKYESKNHNHPQPFHAQKEELQTAPAKVATYVNGQKTVVSIDTKPPLPLLDISLLEPLTFDNPLVPQVQHFLPRINEATYHKLPNYNIYVNNNQKEEAPQKSKYYEGEIVNGKPKSKNKTSKKKQNGSQSQSSKENHHPKPSVTVNGTPNESPEFSYEINSPNYKETYKEQVVSYNKETKSEPVNYSYNKESQSKPVQYSYKNQVQSKPVHYSNVHSSKAPQQEMMVYYENDGQSPKHLVYTSKSGYKNDEQNIQSIKAQPAQAHDETQNDSAEDHTPPVLHQNIHIEHEEYAGAPKSPQHLAPEHREEVNHQKITQDAPKVDNHEFPKSFMELINAQINNGHFQPITPEYNNKGHLLPTHKSNENIRVNPSQHIQQTSSEKSSSEEHDTSSPNQQFHEKPKQVVVRDEPPESVHLHHEKENTETDDHEENNEENFEQDYKNAAFGFPGYHSNSEDIEKEIYNPAAYGVSRQHSNFDIEHAPFQQYYEEGNKFPKQTHSNYKDSRDKLKEDYFLDYSVSKPESMIDRHQNKVEYYKMYKNHRPEEYFGSNRNAHEENEKHNAKYYAAPAYVYNYAPAQQQKQQNARYRTSPQIVYEYDYAKGEPRDSAAYGTQPLQRYKTKTQFVEPQFQYGFEPSTLPHLLESELASMASNVSPESEKPGSTKKLYKGNWYIKNKPTSNVSPVS